MAERKSGPVKPPVIDLKARDAAETPDADKAAAGADGTSSRRKPAASRRSTRSSASEPAKGTKSDSSAAAEPPSSTPSRPSTGSESGPATPPPPRPAARLAMPWSAISVAAVAGAVLGAGLTYLAANWIALPQQEPPFDDPTPALEALLARAEALETRLGAVEDTARNTRVSLDATLAQIDTTSAELRQQIADVTAAIPEPQTVDLSAIEADLETLDDRVAAIGAGASSDDAAALAQNLASMERTLAAMSDRLDGFETRIGAGDGRIESLASELEAARLAIAAQTRTLGGTNIGPAVKLPLIVSGLEAAFASGRPYAAELDGLTTLLPDLAVPKVLADKADSGLARPDAIAARFDAALPDIIAGRTRESTGDLAQDALEWAKALLALRPAVEIEGDTPEAIVSRLEAAVGRRDFVAAATELAQLPAPMQAAAGDVGADIAAHAQAEAFVTRLRTEALAPALEPAN